MTEKEGFDILKFICYFCAHSDLSVERFLVQKFSVDLVDRSIVRDRISFFPEIIIDKYITTLSPKSIKTLLYTLPNPGKLVDKDVGFYDYRYNLTNPEYCSGLDTEDRFDMFSYMFSDYYLENIIKIQKTATLIH